MEKVMNKYKRLVYTVMVLVIGFGVGLLTGTTERPAPMLLIPIIAAIGLFEFGNDGEDDG